MAKKKYVDSAQYPIIAFDFDDTININGGSKYPECGEVRKCAKEVINFLHEIGCKIVIWTSRDVAYNQDEKVMYDHLTPMLKFLDANGIEYDAINKSVQFAPYHYNGRKVYAHLYVDDRAFGWKDTDDIMVKVLQHVLVDIIGISINVATQSIVRPIYSGCEVEDYVIEYCKGCVEEWKS